MIYLIGGSPRSGKTIFSQMLAQKLSCQLISLDDLRTKEIEKLGEKAFEKFPFEVKYLKNIDALFQDNFPEKILSIEIEEAHALWPQVKKIIQDNLQKDADMIIEGVQLLPELIERYKNNNEIKILFFYKENGELILSGFHKNSASEDWLLSATRNPETLEKAAATYAIYGKYFKEETRKYDFELINTENNFENTLKTILQKTVDES